MEYTPPRPFVTVRLRRSTNKKAKAESWNLVLEITNVMRNGQYTKVYEAVHRTITTPVWETRNKNNHGSYTPKRYPNGVIVCESPLDQEACQYADKLRQKRQHDYDLAQLYEGHSEELSEMERKKLTDVVAYFRQVAEFRHPNSKSSLVSWLIAADKLEQFLKGKHICFRDINLRFINDYRSYLLTMHNSHHVRKKGVKVSTNTAARYFMFFRAVLHQAFNEGYLDIDIAAKTTAIEKEIKIRDAFTAEEIDALAVAPCKDDNLKRSALFSALTGLRLGDLRSITWGQLRQVNGKWHLNFIQNKTKQTDYLPISDQAFDLCGHPGSESELIFPELKITAGFKPALNAWLKEAGITRHMTFHCFRHTFATLQLEGGTDIYTIKEMMGHRSVNTTMLYSHIVDSRKRDAMERLNIDGLNFEF